jgi:hypothetical protein
MTPDFKVEVDTSRFDRGLRIAMTQTSRDIIEMINARMFYVLLRIFVLVPPKNIKAKQDEVSRYLGDFVGGQVKDKRTGKFKGKGRSLRRVHLVINARLGKMGQPGLYGELMKRVSGKFWRSAVNSVGYLKSGPLKAIKRISRNFSQYGYSAKRVKGKRLARVSANGALLRIADQYEIAAADRANVANFRGSQGYAHNASQGWDPMAVANWRVGVKSGQEGNVSAAYQPAIQKAFDDETAEMEKHLRAVGQDIESAFNEQK